MGSFLGMGRLFLHQRELEWSLPKKRGKCEEFCFTIREILPFKEAEMQ